MATISPTGAVQMNGGSKTTLEAIQKAFHVARSLGPTAQSIRDEATAYLTRLEAGHIADGYEVLEAKPFSQPSVVLSEQAQVKILLAKLESTPILPRRRPTNVWNVEEVAETPEKLFDDALKNLGYSQISNEDRTRVIEETVPKKWWQGK
jgi:hypothetical protein